MRSNVPSVAVLQACLLLGVSASPAPTPRRAYAAPSAEVTLSPTKTVYEKRNIVSDVTSAAGDITSAVANDINTVLSELGSNLPSYVASEVPNFFQGSSSYSIWRIKTDKSQVSRLVMQSSAH